MHGLIKVDANYRYVIDNLVDGAHVLTVHHDTLACESFARAKPEVKVEGDMIWSRLICPPGKPSAIWKQIWEGSREPVTDEMEFDMWADSGWMPGAIILQDTGMMRKGEPREVAVRALNCHLLTPATESSTHYFWAIARDFARDNAGLSEGMRLGAEYTFTQQDSKILSAIQETAGNEDFWAMKPCLLPDDVAAVRVRRQMDELLKAERAATAQG